MMPIVVSVSPCFMTCPRHAALIGAERHADADLRRRSATCTTARHRCDRREQQRKPREAAEELREQARPRD
jgi:hypothetical protein